MNFLTGNEKAIVTDVPGTTRDIIEESISIDDINLNLTDTAGISSNAGFIIRLSGAVLAAYGGITYTIKYLKKGRGYSEEIITN